jgi:hypothetical protein
MFGIYPKSHVLAGLHVFVLSCFVVWLRLGV